MGMTCFAIILIIAVVLTLLILTPTKNEEVPKSTLISDDTARNRVNNLCGVYMSKSDTYCDDDENVFMEFAKEHKDFMSWTFFKVNNKRYAINISKESLTTKAIEFNDNFRVKKFALNAIVYRLTHNTLDGWVPSPEFTDAFPNGIVGFTNKADTKDVATWFGLYEYERGSWRKHGWDGHSVRYYWTPSIIKDGYAIINRYDELVESEYEQKFYLPELIERIYNLELGRTIIEL